MPRGLEDLSELSRSGLGAKLRSASSVSSTLTWDAGDPSSSLCALLSPSSREYVTVDSGGTLSGASDTRGESLDRGVRTTLVSGAGASGADDGSPSGAM